MDGWTIGIILFDLAALWALWKVRGHVRALPAPRVLAPVDNDVAARHLAEAADILGLELQRNGLSASLHGERGGLAVRVEPLGVLRRPDNPDTHDLKVALHDRTLLDGQLRLHNRIGDADPHERDGARCETGDAVFDQAFSVAGPRAPVRARLDPQTRSQLLELPGRITTQIGTCVYSTRALFEGANPIVAAVEDAIRAARALGPPEDEARALADIAQTDTWAAARRGALEALVDDFPGHPALEATARTCLADQEPQIRLLAARVLGGEARAVIVELVQSPGPTELRSEAFTLAAEALGAPAAVGLIEARLADPQTEPVLAVELAERAAALGLVGAARPIAECLPRAPTRVMVELLRALGDLGDPSTEPTLLPHLRHHNPEVRVAAAGALGAMGTPAALDPLRTAASGCIEASVKARMQWAQDQIRARCQVEAGRLSFSDPGAEGAVSVSEDPGALGLPE